MNSTQVSDRDLLLLSDAESSTRREQVRVIFDNVDHYLAARSVDVRLRTETVSAFASQLSYEDVLDAGCGDGSITLPLLTSANHLTWMDLSPSMLEHAISRVPRDLVNNVTLRNEDILTAQFGTKRFDLVVSVGVIAHVQSVVLFLEKLRKLLKPGGSLILEFTDVLHPVGKLGRLWSRLKEQLAPAKYQTNRLSASTLRPLFSAHGLRSVAEYRYSRLPLPGADRLLSDRIHYRLCRWIFGDTRKNTRARWGNEYICLLVAE